MKTLRTLLTFRAALAALLLSASPLAFGAAVTYPGPQATDTSGAAVTSGVTGNIVSVTDLDGNAVASPGAVFHVAGGNPSVVYDAAAKGEAWITYSLTASGHTFNNVALFCSADPQTLASANTQATSAASSSASNGTAIAALPSASANATAVWGAGTRTLTAQSDTAGTTTLLSRLPQALLFDGSGYVKSNAQAVQDKTGYTVSTVSDKTGYSLTTGEHTAIAGDVLGATASSYNSAGTIGQKINTSGSANDPWTTTLPGAYSAGQAGYILGTNLNATVSSRSTYSGTSQTGDAYALLSPLISAGKYTASALSNAPTGGGTAQTGDVYALISPLIASNKFTSSALGNVWNYPVAGGYTSGQTLAALGAVGAKLAPVSNSWNATTHVLSTTYQYPGASWTVTTQTQYPSSQTTAPPVASITVNTPAITQP